MSWLAQTRGTALVYPQAQLSTPNPPIPGPAPGMSGQLGISHSKRLPQMLISHVQEDAVAIKKSALQSDLHPSTQEADQLSFPVPPAFPEGLGPAPQHPSLTQDLPRLPLLPCVACPDVLGTLSLTPSPGASQVSPPPQWPFAGFLLQIVAPCFQVHSPPSHQSEVLKHAIITFSQKPLWPQN